MAHSSWIGCVDLQGWCRVMWTLKSDYCSSCAQWGTAWACTASGISVLSQQKNYLQICYSLHFVSNTEIDGRKQSFLHQCFKLWKRDRFTIPRNVWKHCHIALKVCIPDFDQSVFCDRTSMKWCELSVQTGRMSCCMLQQFTNTLKPEP